MGTAEAHAAQDPRPSGSARPRLVLGLGLLLLGLGDLLYMKAVLLPQVLADQAGFPPGLPPANTAVPSSAPAAPVWVEPPPPNPEPAPPPAGALAEAHAAPAAPAEPPAPAPAPVHAPAPASFSPLLFSPNSAWLSQPSHQSLAKLAVLLKKEPTLRVRLDGHTDDFGPERFNQVLSLKRAQQAREHLLGQGIVQARIDVKGYGSQQPADSERTAKARARNRRVEIIFY